MPLLRLSRLEHAPDEQASQHKGKGEDRCKDGANVWEARFRALDQAHVGSGLCPRVRTEWMLAEQADLHHTTSTFVEVKDYLCLPRCRSEEHTSELQSLMRISYAVFCLKKKKYQKTTEK